MSGASPSSSRRQRRALYNAHTAKRRRLMSVPLSKDLRARFHRRALPLRKGDTVRILEGSYEGREERVAKVDRRALAVTLDNVTSKTGESKQTPLPVRTGSLVLVHLNLADPWRRRRLNVTEAELTPEELGIPPSEPEGTEAMAPTAPTPSETPTTEKENAPTPDDEPTLEDLLDDEDEDDDENEDDEEEDPPMPPKGSVPTRRRAKPKASSSPSSGGGA